MPIETNDVGGHQITASPEKQEDAARRQLVRDLAELLVEWDEMQQYSDLNGLGNELERTGIFNQLHPGMSVDEAYEHLLYLIETFNLLRTECDNESELLQDVMKLDAHERGEWALSRLMSNISNEDS